MRTPPFTSLVHPYIQTWDAEGSSWSTRRKHYIWKDEEKTRALEAFLKTPHIRKWCMSVSATPSFKMRSKCSTGESGWEAACLQCLRMFQLVELSLYFYLEIKMYLQNLGKQANSDFWIPKSTALHLCHHFIIEHLVVVSAGTLIGW